jgi:hypothetical protein
MVIITSYYYFYSYECQGIQTKIPFDEILSLSFDLRLLKVHNNVLNRNQFCKGLSKDSYNKTHLMEKKLRG